MRRARSWGRAVLLPPIRYTNLAVALNTPQVLSPANPDYQTLTDFWTDLKFRLMQGKEIPAKSIHEHAIYSSGPGKAVPVGERVELEYDAAKIAADTITIEVDTPDGQHV